LAAMPTNAARDSQVSLARLDDSNSNHGGSNHGGRIELTGLRKEFGDFVAVDDIDLVIEPGEF
jgi:hypothetical protein